jgi:glutathione peroxidase
LTQPPPTSLYSFAARALGGDVIGLEAYRGRVVLIVNTASQCGFTPQYAGLEALWRKYKDRGFAVLGFPCNQFGAQEPGSAEDIASFCSLTYDVTFPMFAKIEVNGPKRQKKGLLGSEAVKWNFTKFLVDRNGRPAKRFGPGTEPKALESAIEALL